MNVLITLMEWISICSDGTEEDNKRKFWEQTIRIRAGPLLQNSILTFRLLYTFFFFFFYQTLVTKICNRQDKTRQNLLNVKYWTLDNIYTNTTISVIGQYQLIYQLASRIAIC